MKELPIRFSTPMVRALLANRKTQTRRALTWPSEVEVDESELERLAKSQAPQLIRQCPYGTRGDQLHVREAFRFPDYLDKLSPQLVGLQSVAAGVGAPIMYEADGARRNWKDTRTPLAIEREFRPGKLRPSMFMPKWASRIKALVIDVRVERLQEITECDAMSEGVTTLDDEWLRAHFPDYCARVDATPHGAKPPLGPSPRARFERLWNSLNNTTRHRWDSNPWVWVVEFEQVTS